VMVLIALSVSPSLSNIIASEQSLRDAARQAGIDPQELIDANQVLTDSLAAPGRTSIPVDELAPRVVLPGQMQTEALVSPFINLQEEALGEAENSLFGSSFFRLGPELFQSPSFGPVPENYPLGIGDQVFIDVWGEVEFLEERIVDRDGTIILPKGGKILCAGRSLSDVEKEVRRRLSGSYSGIAVNGEGGDTFISVSLGKLRAIRVFVVGEAQRPGAYELGSLSTIFTALYAAGGPGDAGSFRTINLIRNGQTVGSLDLYDYLLEGRRGDDIFLREGDTIYVPSRKRTVVLSGAVKRPRHFELAEEETLGNLLRFGGGFQAGASVELLHLQRILPPEDRRPELPDRVHLDIDSRNLEFTLADGDIIEVSHIGERVGNWVEILGNVKRPGRYEYTSEMSVVDLVALAGGPWRDTLEERALLDRVDESQRRYTTDFHLGRQLAREDEAITLLPMDQLKVFSLWELTDRTSLVVSGEVRNPGNFEYRELCTLRDLILKAGGLLESADLLNAEIFRLDRSSMESRRTGQSPDRYVDVIKVPLGDDWLSKAESFPLMPHDHIAIRKLPWWELQRQVEVRGELFFPGNYSLEHAETRLSNIVASAGGLKCTADILGARIDRKQDDIGVIGLELGKALVNPGGQHDPVLAPGDVITIPPISNTVKVVGAVRFATSATFISGRSLREYVEMAGGFAEGADGGKAHVVYPNGISRPLRWFGLKQPKILPGSTIVIPWEKPSDSDGKLETLREIASIFASLATVWLVIERTN
jgi:protein involved in polysaccharide export with SLBB domain